MAVKEFAARVEELLEPAAKMHGYELVAVEQAGGRHTPVIRVLLDREDGIDVDALTSANVWVSDILDNSMLMTGPYTLEVSSPGIDRPLRKIGDFERFVGETASVKTASAKGRSAWTGTIARVDGSTIVLLVDGEEVAVPFSDINKARLKGVVDFGKGGPK